MRNKLVFSVPVVDTANNNNLKTISGITAKILRPSARISTAGSANDSGTGYIECYSVAGIQTGDQCYVVASDGTIKDEVILSVTAINPSGAGSSEVTMSVTNSVGPGGGGTISWSDGDRLALRHDHPSSYGLATIYKDNSVNATATSNPITLSDNGMVEVWTNEPEVDVYVSGTGVTAKYFHNIPAIPEDALDLAQFGVVGNGTDDDTAAIQAALNFAGANKTIVVPLGTLKISSVIEINNSGVRIVGMGFGSEIRQTGESTGALSVFNLADGVNDVIISNLKISSTGAYGTPGRGLIMFNSSGGSSGNKRCFVTNCWLQSTGTSAIAASGLQDSVISDNIIDNNGGTTGEHGIYLSSDLASSSGCIVSSNQILNSGQTASVNQVGIQLSGGSKHNISGNIITGWNSGVLVSYNSKVTTDTIIKGNTISDITASISSTGYGIFIPDDGALITTKLQILDNTIFNCAKSGIRCDGNFSKATIRGNTIYLCGEPGMRLSKVVDSTVSDNHVYDNGSSVGGGGLQSGIRLYDSNNDNFFSGNKCHDTGAGTQLYGLSIYSTGGTGNTFLNNEFGPCVTDEFDMTPATAANQTWLQVLDNGDIAWGNPLSNPGLLKSDGTANILASQETVASANTVTIGNDTDTVILTGTTDVRSIATAIAGRKLNVIATDASGVTLVNQYSAPAISNEFILTNGADLHLGQYDMVTFECVDLATRKIWVQVSGGRRNTVHQQTKVSTGAMTVGDTTATLLLTGTTTVNSIATAVAGRRLTVINTDTGAITLKHNATGSTTANEMLNYSGVDLSLGQNQAVTYEGVDFSGTVMWVQVD